MQLHECHPGSGRMKSLARCYVWWPKIDAETEETVCTWTTCQLSRPLPSKAPIHHWEYPTRPWARIKIDNTGPFLGLTYLVVFDAFSKWIETHLVPSTLSEATIKALRSVFSIHVIPEHLISDNETGPTSQEFATFLNENGFHHSHPSPYHPSFNGLAEHAVQTVKQGISKLEVPIQLRLDRFLLSYRTTPQTTTGLTHSEILMGRRLCTRLDYVHPDSIKRVIETQKKQRGTSSLKKFNVEDKLYARNYSGCDNCACVLLCQESDWSFIIRSGNRRHKPDPTLPCGSVEGQTQ